MKWLGAEGDVWSRNVEDVDSVDGASDEMGAGGGPDEGGDGEVGFGFFFDEVKGG